MLHTRRFRPLLASFTALCMVGGLGGLAPRPAAAAVIIAPVMPFMPYYGPYVPYYEIREPYLQVDNEYYEVSLSGLDKLCRSRPELCAGTAQQEGLDSLHSRRAAGIGLLVTGIVGLVGGTVWSLATIHEDAFGYVDRANYIPLYVGLGMGITLPLIGGVLMPHADDVVDFVNGSNRAHPDELVRIHLSGAPKPTAGLAVSWNF
jgi:hypothetical protein